MDKLYITGHKNPDTDSICAALAYAEFKNKKKMYHAEAIRLGDLNAETKFVLDYFGVEPPRYKDSMKPQVRDLNMDRMMTVASDVPISKAISFMQENRNNCLAVVNGEESLEGIVTLGNVTRATMDIWDDGIIGRAQTPIQNIIDVLSAKVLHMPKKRRPYTGNIAIYAMTPDKGKANIQENDIVLIGDRTDSQAEAINKNIPLMILTLGCQLDEELLQKAKERDIAVLSTEFNTFMASRVLPQAIPVSYVMTTENLVCFRKDDYVEDVQQVMADTRFRSYPVLDSQNKVIGSISRYHLIINDKKRLVLVDHNEKNQSIDDIEAADIIEIIDHHRVANISTSEPVYFRNEPLGSTSTIISKMFFESGIRPSRQTAGLLCAAIISDTLLFRSPTSTDTDRQILARMAKYADIDVEKFAMEMFRAGTSLKGKDISDLLNGDVKQFVIDHKKIRVAQIFTLDLEGLEGMENKLYDRMESIRKLNDEDTFVLMLTDIFHGRSKVIVCGNYGNGLARAFETTMDNHMFIAEGLLSRKKQLIPQLSHAITE